jgi:putative ABC transport system permease protein
MFDLDNWNEIFSTIKKNKLRTFLTGFAISWGIFMFCILLSAGNGLRNGMVTNFGSRSVNSVQYWARSTSIPFQGLPDRRAVRLNNQDIELIRTQVPQADIISPMVSQNLPISYGMRNTNSSFEGVNPEFVHINGITIKDNQGRFINEMDMREKRKVVVINQRLNEILFPNENPIGKMVTVGGLGYTVIGVFEENTWGNQEKAYVPFTTAQILYGLDGWRLHRMVFTVNNLTTIEEYQAFEQELRGKLSTLHHFDPADIRAIGIWNQLESYLEFLGIFNGISAFIWIIGIGTLIAGITGVSNIMLITVRERTREIGIRKALGAKPSSILGNILMEAVFITSIFGYLGMFLGVGLGELVNSALESMPPGQMPIKNPTIDVHIAIGAMLILMLSGLVAGYFPALKAVKISPIEAMRAE